MILYFSVVALTSLYIPGHNDIASHIHIHIHSRLCTQLNLHYIPIYEAY